ncbi:hypothetical protein NKH73_32055, partial [Mesorhizobium sp. M0938]
LRSKGRLKSAASLPGHAPARRPSPERYDFLVGHYYLGSVRLDEAASLLGRKVDETTLEPFNLEIYKRAKELPLAYAEKIFEFARKIRFDVGKAVQKLLHMIPSSTCRLTRF